MLEFSTAVALEMPPLEDAVTERRSFGQSRDQRRSWRDLLLWLGSFPTTPAVGGSIDGDDIVTGASINGGIECTECADVALSGSIGVDEETVVTAA